MAGEQWNTRSIELVVDPPKNIINLIKACYNIAAPPIGIPISV